MTRGRPPQNRVTLATVAGALGVSRATVSNAYNHPSRLSPALRRQVLRVADELGYPGPSPLAATLSRGRVNAVGLVLDDAMSYAFTDPAEVEFLQGVSEVCEREEQALVLIAGGPSSAIAKFALVDGVVCHCDLTDDVRLTSITDRGLPHVIVDGPPRPGAGHVGIDDRAGARDAAAHLTGLGHTRLGVVTMRLHPDRHDGPPSPQRQDTISYRVGALRLGGYREAVERAGLPWESVLLEERYDNDRAAGRSAATALLTRHRPRPTALLAMSDELAIGALQAAADLGIDVPGQLSVVGFDDTSHAATTRPALTTVRQPHREKGRRATEMLLGRGVTEELLSSGLVVRASTGPPGPDVP